MDKSDREIIRDILMYLAGAIDASSERHHADSLNYVRKHLKHVYDKNWILPKSLEELPIIKNIDKC